MSKKKYHQIAKRYRPVGVKVRFKRPPNLAPAHAKVFRDGTKEILTPRPDNREGLYYFLHECAHLILRHFHIPMPIWQMEYEAEMWTIATMRREGIPVPHTMLYAAKKYVKDCIREGKAKGEAPPPYKVRRWAGV
jgi:hypothetical protein